MTWTVPVSIEGQAWSAQVLIEGCAEAWEAREQAQALVENLALALGVDDEQFVVGEPAVMTR